jgi:hypothetical protein
LFLMNKKNNTLDCCNWIHLTEMALSTTQRFVAQIVDCNQNSKTCLPCKSHLKTRLHYQPLKKKILACFPSLALYILY